MHFTFKKRILPLILLAVCINVTVFVTSCASTNAVPDSPAGNKNDFVRKQLSNGIPVIYRQNRGSKIVVFRLVFEGGTSAIDKSLGGIEDLTLNLALHGTEKYPYETIKQLAFEKSFSLSASSGKDYSSAGFVCIQRDLAEVLSIFTDCILNPAFLEDEYSKMMKEVSVSIASKKADPSGTLGLAISKAAFKDHPYATSTSVTEETYPNINLTMVRGLHQSLLNAFRMKIVVVGNFSDDFIESFTGELEAAFGQIGRKAYSAPKIPKISHSSETVRTANEQAGDSGYIAGLFECPNRTDSDYVPFAIASMYLDDLFFSQVREKAGSVYSINTGVIGGKQLHGVISLFKASEKKEIKKQIMEAISSFSEEDISRKLEQYKNQYITTIFSSSQTAAGLASSVVSSLEYLGSETEYLNRTEIVRAVEAKDVIAAYKKYLEPVAKRNAVQWIVVDSEKNLNEYDF